MDLGIREEELFATGTMQQMRLAEAISKQHAVVECISRNFSGAEFLEGGDYGQALPPDGQPLGAGGGRPRRTRLVEKTIASVFSAEDARLVLGAGTGAVATALGAVVHAGGTLLIHRAPMYKTTQATVERLEIRLISADFNDPRSIRDVAEAPDAALVQHIPQKPGDRYDLSDVIGEIKQQWGAEFPVVVDDNYAVMRAGQIGVELGADVSAFSMFKLLGPEGVGCLVGRKSVLERAVDGLTSAGCQVQGPIAAEALRALVYAPVSLALQGESVEATAKSINQRLKQDPVWSHWIRRAGSLQAAHPNVVLVLQHPVAERLLQQAWVAGAAPYAAGEESRYDIIPIFTHLASNFVKAAPGLKDFAVRINPFRAGPETVLRILDRALSRLNQV